MRNSKTLELFESFKKEFEKEDEVLNECELPSTKDGTARKEIEDQLERTRKRREEIGIDESEKLNESGKYFTEDDYMKFCKFWIESNADGYVDFNEEEGKPPFTYYADDDSDGDTFESFKEMFDELEIGEAILGDYDEDNTEGLKNAGITKTDIRKLDRMFDYGIFEESEKLEEKINKDNIEINRAIANPNLGKNKEKIKAAGYDVNEYDGRVHSIKNPKTGKSVLPFAFNKEGKQKVDFKGKLDSERPYTGKLNVRDNYAGKGKLIPNKAVVGKDKYGNKIVRADDFDDYSSHTSMMDDKPNYKSISQNVNDYKQAVKDRDEKANRAERDKRGLSYYEDKVKRAQEDLDREKKYIEDNEKGSKAAEDRRREIINKIRAKRKTESEEFLKESEDFEDKLKEIYNSYKQDGMEDAFWSDLMNCIDNIEYLNQWYDSLDESEQLEETCKVNKKLDNFRKRMANK